MQASQSHAPKPQSLRALRQHLLKSYNNKSSLAASPHILLSLSGVNQGAPFYRKVFGKLYEPLCVFILGWGEKRDWINVSCSTWDERCSCYLAGKPCALKHVIAFVLRNVSPIHAHMCVCPHASTLVRMRWAILPRFPRWR